MGVRLVRLSEGAQLVSVSVVAAEPEEAAEASAAAAPEEQPQPAERDAPPSGQE